MTDEGSRWAPAARFAFRFCVLYFGLTILLGQMLTTMVPLPGVDVPSLDTLPPVRTLVTWVARNVFGVAGDLVVTGSGSGDKTFDWVEAFCFVVIAAAGAAIWSWRARDAREHAALRRRFRVLARLALGATMVSYGIVKVVPLQMPLPWLHQLVQPFGQFSPMGVLWSSVGASPAYETFLGTMEVLGGLLVLLPWTSTLGALVCLGAALHVFVLNLTYDVPVKLFSFHLVLLSLLVLAPDARRLVDFFVLDRGAGPSAGAPREASPRARKLAAGAQVLFAAFLVAGNLADARTQWAQRGGAAPRSPLYGIWDVDGMSVDGAPRPPLLTDAERWRRVVFQRTAVVAFQRMDDSFVRFGAALDARGETLSLTRPGEATWRGSLAVERPAPGRLVLDGTMGEHRVRLELRLVDPSRFLLLSRGFHWIQEYPFNR